MQLINRLAGNKKIIYYLLLIALVIRLVIALYNFNSGVWKDFADDQQRELFAYAIFDHGFIPSFEDADPIEYLIAPFIPIVILISKLLFGNSWLPLFIINSIIGALSCLVIYLIALRYTNNTVALLSFLWASFYPNFIRYTATAGNEPWIVFLFLLSLYLVIRSIELNKITKNLLFLALVYTLLFHTDERYIAYAPLFAAFLLIGVGGFWGKFKKVILFAFLFILFSLPWLVRNYLVLNEVIVVSTRTASITNPIFNHRQEIVFNHLPSTSTLSTEQIDSVLTGNKLQFTDGRPISKQQIDAMKEGFIPYKFSKTEAFFSRVYFLWLPFKFKPNYRIDGYNFMGKWSLRHNLSSILTYGIFLPFMLLGLIAFFLEKKWEPLIIFLSLILYHTLIHAAFIPYTRDRYRHPIDFIIPILAFYSVFFLFHFIKNRRFKSL